MILFVSVLGAMGITFTFVECGLRTVASKKEARYVKFIGWLTGTVFGGSLSLGAGWLLSGLSEEYWEHLAKSNYVWGMGIASFVCLGAAQIPKNGNIDDR